MIYLRARNDRTERGSRYSNISQDFALARQVDTHVQACALRGACAFEMHMVITHRHVHAQVKNWPIRNFAVTCTLLMGAVSVRLSARGNVFV